MFVVSDTRTFTRSQSMHRKLALTAVLAVALAVTGYAQKKDFSGTWNLDQAATDAAATTTTAPPAGGGGGGMRGGGGGATFTIKQTGDALAIERPGRGGGAPTTVTYKFDGSEVEVPMGRGGTGKAKAKWDGDKIVIETTGAGQDGAPVTTTATYALDASGMLWIETKNAMGTVKRAYKKAT
jgi:hypothetical protein